LVSIQKSDFNSKEFFVPGLTFHFMDDEIIYFKSEITKDLDQNLGDIHGFIVGNSIVQNSFKKDKENVILHQV
jgi:hypothetical protein